METAAFGPWIRALDYVGVATFAVSGSLAASRKRLDPIGFLVVATATGIGGGTLRDLLLGRSPVFWIDQPVYLWICFGSAAATFFLAARLASRSRWLLWADAVGLAVFTLIGSEIALRQAVPPLVAVTMGVMTATFGGLLRDVVCREVPLILHREIYATAAAAGGAAYALLRLYGPGVGPAVATGFVVTLGIRGWAILRGLRLPIPRA